MHGDGRVPICIKILDGEENNILLPQLYGEENNIIVPLSFEAGTKLFISTLVGGNSIKKFLAP